MDQSDVLNAGITLKTCSRASLQEPKLITDHFKNINVMANNLYDSLGAVRTQPLEIIYEILCCCSVSP